MCKGGTVDYLNVIQVQTIMLQDKLSSGLDLGNRMQQTVTRFREKVKITCER